MAIEKLLGKPLPVGRGDWRPGDQKVFVADIRKAEKVLGWKPKYPDLRSIIDSAWRWHVAHPKGYAR